MNDAKGKFWANASHASRKDARDAVQAARSAFAGWSGRTAYNRGQVVYRIAEVLEDRREQFESELRTGRGDHGGQGAHATSTPRSTGSSGTPAGPTRSPRSSAGRTRSPGRTSTTPPPSRPAWSRSSHPRGPLLGLVSVVAPVIVTGNTAVVVASEPHPLTSITLAEVMATSDVPGGVVNVLTGPQAELAPWLASHMDVNGLDLTGVTDAELARNLEIEAAENLKRVRRPGVEDLLASPALDRMTTFLETKTVWHPIGV